MKVSFVLLFALSLLVVKGEDLSTAKRSDFVRRGDEENQYHRVAQNGFVPWKGSEEQGDPDDGYTKSSKGSDISSNGSKSSKGAPVETTTYYGKGAKGSKSANGSKSAKGSKSANGSKSAKGSKSANGSKSAKGSKSLKGSKGAKGSKGECTDLCQVSLAGNDFYVFPGESCRSKGSKVNGSTRVCCEEKTSKSGNRSRRNEFDMKFDSDFGLLRQEDDDDFPGCVRCRNCDAPQVVSDDCCKAKLGYPCGENYECCKCVDGIGFNDEFACIPDHMPCREESCTGDDGSFAAGSEVCLFGDTCEYQGRAEGVCCSVEGEQTCMWCDECDYPQVVHEKCCLDPKGRRACPDGKYCCKCGPENVDMAYKCVDDPGDCDAACLPSCGEDSNPGHVAKYCKPTCLSLVNMNCGCSLNPQDIGPSEWERISNLCESSGGVGGLQCCTLKPDACVLAGCGE